MRMEIVFTKIGTQEIQFFSNCTLPNHKEIDEIIDMLQQLKNEMTDEDIDKKNDEYWESIHNFGNNKKNNKKKEKKKQEGYIYVIKSNKHYKIGRTLSPKQRIKKYITENPNKIEVILCKKVKDYVGAEKELHSIFEYKNHNREWFNLNDEEISLIKSYLEEGKV